MSKEALVFDSDSEREEHAGRPSSSAEDGSRKRKRDDKTFSELEVDVAAPEPPSKKALRKAKKTKPASTAPIQASDVITEEKTIYDANQEQQLPRRSDYGVWVGNLSWTTTMEELKKFILDEVNISDIEVTRINMPAPKKAATESSRWKIKPQNKGFAYVDFTSADACKSVVALSESTLAGRKLLIKDAKSFEGRPDAAKTKEKDPVRAPNKRIFVGNLEFDTSENVLREHFSQCGDIDMVFMATFEDSGKCKGYAWITFRELESAEKAVRGWVDMQAEQSEDEIGGFDLRAAKKQKKPRRWWVNRLNGRTLRMEFAEDQTLRYNKRYGKSLPSNGGAEVGSMVQDTAPQARRQGIKQFSKEHRVPKGETEHEHKVRTSTKRPKHAVDARNIRPGAALALAPRQTAAIVQGQGKKITFD